jgi:hypothetical protein
MALQTFIAGQTLTASQMNTLQASDYNYTRNVQSGTTYTLVLADRGKLVEFQNNGGTIVTIPSDSTTAFEIGDIIEILNGSTGLVALVGAGGVTVDAEAGVTTIAAQWQRATLIKRAANSWVITGIAAGVIGDNSVTSSKIVDGTIVNADINASAGIALSKLASATSAQVIVHNASGVPTAVSVTGDVTISNAGVTSISSGSIVNADVSATAAIEQNKIADMTIDTKVASYAININDKNKMIEMNVGSNNTVSVPTNAAAPFPVGTQIHVVQYGAGKTQIVAASPATTTVRATPGSFLRAQYSSATLIKRAADEWYLVGDLSAT